MSLQNKDQEQKPPKEDDVKTARFNVGLPEELNDRLQKLIPWGSKNKIILCLLDKLLEEAALNPSVVVSDVLGGKFRILCENAEKLKKLSH